MLLFSPGRRPFIYTLIDFRCKNMFLIGTFQRISIFFSNQFKRVGIGQKEVGKEQLAVGK
jgi:hypothetical protein